MKEIIVLLVLGFCVWVIFFKTTPAGYHIKNKDGSYSPVQTTLFKSLIR